MASPGAAANHDSEERHEDSFDRALRRSKLLERAGAVQLHEERPRSAGSLLIVGDADRAAHRSTVTRRAGQLAIRRAKAALEEDPRAPLVLAGAVFPDVDRRAADRAIGKGHVKQLEPAMTGNHLSTVAGPATRSVGCAPAGTGPTAGGRR